MVPVQDSYMQNRAEALQNVESTITELSNIFTQLATMVAQQGEVAIRYVVLIKPLLSTKHLLICMSSCLHVVRSSLLSSVEIVLCALKQLICIRDLLLHQSIVLVHGVYVQY